MIIIKSGMCGPTSHIFFDWRTHGHSQARPVRPHPDREFEAYLKCGRCGGAVKVIVGAPNRCIEDQDVIDKVN